MSAHASPLPVRRRALLMPVTAGLGVVALAAGALLGLTTRAPSSTATTAAAASLGSPLEQEIARTQDRLRAVPRDFEAWATLGFDDVQEAKVTVDPTYYPRAAAALVQSLRLDSTDNFVAMAGEAALANARHDFRSALQWARRGLTVDPHNAALFGALTDALTQLGNYAAAERAARQMEELSPGTPAETRLSYAAELRGDLPAANAFMQQALDDSGSPTDVAFTRYYLGELALTSGRPRAALVDDSLALAAMPDDPAALEGRAKAEAALGEVAAAERDFRSVVDRVPQPGWVLEFGELLESQGQAAAAAAQYAVFRTEERLFRANGVMLDVDEVLFEADHGDAHTAVAVARTAVRNRPFVETYDAYGWALHRAGSDRAALLAANTALAGGMRNALFLFHRGEIERALGLRAAARRDLARALSIDPTFSPLRTSQARADLHALGGA